MYNLWGLFYLLFHLFFLGGFLFVVNNCGVLLEFSFMNLSSLDLSFMMILDWMSLCFISFVMLISSAVLFYSGVYMSGDLSSNRFITLVNLFVASMGMLIMSPSILSLMLGWDGLGLVSFLLVIYYYNIPSLKSGLVTIYTNRFGDVAMIFGLFYYMNGGNWSSVGMLINSNWNFIGLFLVLAGMTKSAQLPFSAWLPAAMAAPTPVSSLVHSSTLVTAGVYLILRFYYLMSNLLETKFLGLIFLLTALLAGLVACFEPDLKSVVAMSTLSQLGLMLFILSVGDFIYCYYHMVCHALFKALLFLSCGMLISLATGGQDTRFFGGTSCSLPGISVLMGISSLSLMGFPFMSGFYSKDSILESSVYFEEYGFFMCVLLFCCVLTAVYSFKLFKVGLTGSRLGYSTLSLTESMSMMVGMTVLGLWSICLGSSLNYLIFVDPILLLNLNEKLMGLWIVFIGLILGLLNVWNLVGDKKVKEFFGELGFLSWFSSKGFSQFLYGMILGVKGDALWGELMGPKGVSNVLVSMGDHLFLKGIISLKGSILISVLWGFLLYNFI